MADFIQRLRRRKLVQWSLAYVAAAFALIQILDIVAQRFGWPDQVIRITIIALSIGFFVVIVLAWYHGERGAQRVSGTELLILALLLAVGGGFLWRVGSGTREGDSTGASTMPSSPANAAPQSVAAIPAKSIAVLPFDNLSDEKANAYFATGMQDEILTRLAGIGDLKVISRTSTAQYASHPTDLKTVGHQLGVAAVLEGSVQKAGDKAHINLQLIDTQNDRHLWADSYDRELKDIFAVERDIAEKVAEILKAKLLPEEIARVAVVSTQSTEAHDLFLRGMVYFNRANDQFALTPTEMPQAIALFEQARAKDPQFAQADANLATAHMNMYWFGPDRTAGRLAAAKSAAEQALARQPDLGEAHYALALYHYWGFRDYTLASQQLELARKNKPNDADVETIAASIARRQAQWERSLAGYRQAALLNPRASITHFLIGETSMQLRRYAEAEAAHTRAVELAADPGAALVRRADLGVTWKGDLAALHAALDTLTPGSDAYSGNIHLFFRAAFWSRDYAAAIKVAESSPRDNWAEYGNIVLPRKLYLAQALEATGDKERARSLYSQLREQLAAELKTAAENPDLHAALGVADAGLGLADEAIAEGRKAAELLPVSRDAFTGPVYLFRLAQICVHVGRKDQAIDLLQQLFAIPAGNVISPALLKIDPIWDPLRGDARFEKLVNDSYKPIEPKS
jgi:serine/threonine-protein kinase